MRLSLTKMVLTCCAIFFSQGGIAEVVREGITTAPQPTPCVKSRFSTEGRSLKRVSLKLTNRCNTSVDFQNSVVTFLNRSKLNVRFTGDFGPLSYPDNELKITSTRQSDGKYLATFNLHFPDSLLNSQLPVNASITIRYVTRNANYIAGSTQVYLNAPVETGSINLINASAKPANVSQDYAVVHVTANGQNISDVQLPWNSNKAVSNIAAGTYNIAADAVTDSGGNTYQGAANPATINLSAGQTVSSTITYSAATQTGKIAIQLQSLPTELNGYTGKPSATVTEVGTGNSTTAALNWGTTVTVSQLKKGSNYQFATPVISYNGYNCSPTFNPTSLTANDPAPTTQLTYTCSQVAQSQVTLNVTGGPSNLSSLKVTLTPNNNTSPVTQNVTLSNGSGTATTMLTTGVIYNVSADPVSGYNMNFNPQPLTAANNAVETITLTAITGDTPVAQNGQLHVCGTQLCNEHNVPIQLRGMSTHGIQWYGLEGHKTETVCLTQASLDTLAKVWKASVIRISLYVQEGGYETDPTAFTKEVNDLIAEASKRGIYAIVDWHMLEPGDPNYNLSRAKTFFTNVANANKGRNNLIYEIANEPSGVNWSTIKNYADQLIPVIRAIDSKTPIIVGTVAWSSLGVSDGRTSQDIINNPLSYPNIMYTFHFYAASHKTEYINELDKASNTLPIFVTEWGSQTYTGDGGNDFTMSDRYMELMARKKIGWTNWNYSDDFRSGAVWKSGTCSGGPWTDSNLKSAGVYVKGKIMG